jgi:NAD(P)-dependent dehydrogenase (short-subunit alcohol dehydrogenase family)
VAVNNAANALTQPMGEYTREAWAKSLDVNLRGPVFLVQQALPHLKRSEHAAVLNVLTGAAFLFWPTVSLWAIGKSGLAAANPTMTAEYAPHRIRVNALSPGTIDTDMVRKNPPETQEVMTRVQLMPRMANPDEMVCPALMLTSDVASFITGHVVFANGGMVPP